MGQKFYQTRIIQRHDLTINWESAPFFKGLAGEIIIYDDRYIIDNKDGSKTRVPGIKICDGVNYLKDLPFIDEMTNRLLTDHEYHLTWNSLESDDTHEEI